MEVLDINETVDVGAVFGNNKIKPKWFMWNSKKYDIKKTTYIWRERSGDITIVHFSVSDRTNIFELCFNQGTMSWQLEKISIE